MQHLLAGVVIFFTCLLTKKYGSKKKNRASRENNLTIDGGKTMGVEPTVHDSGYMFVRRKVIMLTPHNRPVLLPHKPVRARGPRDLHDIAQGYLRSFAMNLFGLAWPVGRTDQSKHVALEGWRWSKAISSDWIRPSLSFPHVLRVPPKCGVASDHR